MLAEWALSMVGVEEGREFRFRGDLYAQESTLPLVLICIEFVYLYFPVLLFVSISQVTGCEDRLRNDIYCVEWGLNSD